MLSTLAFPIISLLFLSPTALATSGTFSLDIRKDAKKHSQQLRKRSVDLQRRQDPFTVTLDAAPYIRGGFYFANVTVGEPPQEIQLQIDTGSADVWMFGTGSCEDLAYGCAGGSFDADSSSTYKIFDRDSFQINYFTQGSEVLGNSIRNLLMGLAVTAQGVTTGIMGIGFDKNEAIIAQAEQETGERPKPYRNLIDRMKDDGLIEARSYSLVSRLLMLVMYTPRGASGARNGSLKNPENAQGSNAMNTGTILFGGYDENRYQGELGILPIQEDAQSGDVSSFSVIWQSVGVTDDDGSTVISTKSVPKVAVLDCGAAITVVPDDIFQELSTYFGAEQDPELEIWLVYCDLDGKKGTVDYQFGNPEGPLISVPFDELAVPFLDDYGDPIKTDNGREVCRFGLDRATTPGMPYLFGDTFLRSAYVIYDLGAQQIAIGQTIFNNTQSPSIKPIRISSGDEPNLPGKFFPARTSIAQTATTDIAGAAQTGAGSPTGGSVPEALAAAAGDGSAELDGYKTTYTNRATNIPGTPGAAGVGRPLPGFVAVGNGWWGVFLGLGGLALEMSVLL
ncbi:MAG: hypothetical protein M1831_006723 [Alyxoria varia]|nr:MAG: hypothetical protein M1831_006723 [Alyxoria varia]